MRVEVCILIIAVAYPLGSAAFDEPFHPEKSQAFDPTVSSTFTPTPRRYALHYADSTELRGFVGEDQVHLDNYHVKAKFGCITYCNSPDFNGVDGIMGFGIPAPSDRNGLPEPLLEAISMGPNDPESKAQPGILMRRVFSFFVTDGAAELQLGGHDPNSIVGPLVKLKTFGAHFYAVKVRGMKYGSEDILHFSPGAQYIQGVVDSGTSCLVIPDSDMEGILDTSNHKTAYQAFKDAEQHKSFHINLDGHWVEIPHSVWYLANSNQTCVQRTPANFPGILIGDVLFRKYLVEFDMTHEGEGILGIAPLNPAYVPTHKPSVGKFVVPKNSPSSTKSPAVDNSGHRVAMLARTEKLTRLPVMDKDETQFFINVSVGTPPQQRLVIFDTGSSVFGLFSKAPMQYTHKAIFGQKKATNSMQQQLMDASPQALMGDGPIGGEQPQIGGAQSMGGMRQMHATQTLEQLAGSAVHPWHPELLASMRKLRQKVDKQRALRKKFFRK